MLDACYLEGVGKKAIDCEAASGLLFSKCLEQQLLSQHPIEQRLFVRKRMKQIGQFLTLTRQDRMKEADDLQTTITESQYQATVSDSCRAIIRSFYFAAKAFYEFKRQDWQAARKLVDRAFEIDTELQGRWDCSVLEMHKVQLAQNYIRVLMAEQRFREAASALKNLMAYVTGIFNCGPLFTDWNSQLLNSVPGELKEAMLSQLAAEFAILACCDRSVEFDFLQDVGESSRVQTKAWFAAGAGNAGKLAELIALGRNYSPALWYSGLLLAANQFSPQSRLKIGAQFSTWANMPRKMAKEFDRLFGLESDALSRLAQMNEGAVIHRS